MTNTRTATGTATAVICAVIYARLSLDSTGEGLAVARQLKLGRGTCNSKGWKIVAELDGDNDLSASGSVERPDFERLLELIAAGQVQVVWAYAMDRLCRNQQDGVRLLQLCREKGVRLEFESGGTLDLSTAMGRAFAEIMLTFAALEIGVKGERQRLANNQRATMGVVRIGTPRPFGWMDDRITPHPVEGPLVVEAYATILGGGSLRSIVAAWNASGVPLPQGARKATQEAGEGAVWRSTTVRGVLLNARHAGLTSIARQVKGEVKFRNDGKGVHVPTETTRLIDVDTYTAVRAILEDKGRATARGVKSLLGGIADCPCGKGHVTAASSSKRGRSYKHYRPAGLNDGLSHVDRRQDHVNDYVEMLVVQRLSREDAHELLETKETGPDVGALRQREEALRVKARELGKRFADSSDEVEQMVLEASLDELRAQLAEVKEALRDASKTTVLGDLIEADDVGAYWENMDVDRKRAVVRELFEYIVLHPPGMGRYPKPIEETVDWKMRG